MKFSIARLPSRSSRFSRLLRFVLRAVCHLALIIGVLPLLRHAVDQTFTIKSALPHGQWRFALERQSEVLARTGPHGRGPYHCAAIRRAESRSRPSL